ncbi:MAG: PAS domain S-box protein, partial [Acidimicrobiia bacterium]|nr:PAS domain S-box protein [Acidimicrobiia bacterium]
MMGQEPPLEGESRTGGAALSGLLGAVDPVTILESSPDGIVITDQDGRILLVNERIEALFGYRREELVGEPIELLVPDRFKDRHIEHRTRYLTTPNSRSMSTALELLGQRRDGSEFPLEISLNPLESGEETYTFAAVRDVTDKVAVESESQAILGTVDAAHDGLFMFSPDTLRFSYANQGAVKQLGYSRQELLEMTPIDIAPEYSEESFRALLAPLLDGTSQSVAVTTVHRNRSGGELPVDIVFNYPPAPRRDVQRRIVALVRDISGRRQLEIERDRGVRWLQSLAALRSTLMTDPPLHEVLTLACQQVRRLTMADAVAICESISNMRLDTEAGSTALFRFRYFDSNDSANILASRQLVHHEAVDRALNGSPVVVHHQGHDAPFGEANRELTSRFDQIMLVPIEGARVVAGLLFVGRRGDEAFTEEEISVATSMAAEAHNAYSLTDARRTKIQVKILEDRERLARDLH